VNQDKFLKDATGNRRYLALECERGFPLWAEGEVDQLWAQAWARYQGGGQWWPTDAEQSVLDVNAERFLQRSWAETRIREMYDFTRLTENNKRLTVTNLWAELCSKSTMYAIVHELKPQQLSEIRAAMLKLWGETGANKREGEQVIKTKCGVVNTYSESGKNKGWLVPMTFEEVESEEKRKKEAAEKKAKHDEKVGRVKELLKDIREGAKTKGLKQGVIEDREQALSILKEEFAEAKANNKMPTLNDFPTILWKDAIREAEGLKPR
jgi:predicted P-loop ATPase